MHALPGQPAGLVGRLLPGPGGPVPEPAFRSSAPLRQHRISYEGSTLTDSFVTP